MPEEAPGAEEGAEEAVEETPTDENESGIKVPDDFDPERAMATIKAQREAEKELKAELAKYKAAEEAEEDKKRTLEERIAARDQRIADLEADIASRQVESDFVEKAREKGLDPKLALAVALQEGLVGEYDPETGRVGEHGLDELGERYPALVLKEGEQEDATPRAAAHGAGTRGKGGRVKTANDLFNEAVRGAIRSRL